MMRIGENESVRQVCEVRIEGAGVRGRLPVKWTNNVSIVARELKAAGSTVLRLPEKGEMKLAGHLIYR